MQGVQLVSGIEAKAATPFPTEQLTNERLRQVARFGDVSLGHARIHKVFDERFPHDLYDSRRYREKQ